MMALVVEGSVASRKMRPACRSSIFFDLIDPPEPVPVRRKAGQSNLIGYSGRSAGFRGRIETHAPHEPGAAAGTYTLVATNSLGTAVSLPCVVEFPPAAPVILT